MLLKNSSRLMVAIVMCSNLFVGSGFGSSAPKSLTQELEIMKQPHVKAIAEHCGDRDYFLKNFKRDFVEMPLVVLEQLNEKKYFLGAIKYRDPMGVLRLGRDGYTASSLAKGYQWNAEITLSGERLRFFPLPLLSFTHVTSIIICHNGLVTLPKRIERLKSLQFLNVSFNNLSQLTPDLCKLPKLTTLMLEGNRIVKLPGKIGTLTSLETLNVEGNRLKGLPDSFGNLSALKFLNLADNQFEETPQILGTLPKIQSITFCKNSLWAVPLCCLSLKTLTTLDLSENDIMLSIADEVDEYEVLREKAPRCLISISGNIDSEAQGQELLRIWHHHNRPKALGVSAE